MLPTLPRFYPNPVSHGRYGVVAVVAITGLCLVFCADKRGRRAKPSACLAFYGVGAAAGFSCVGGAIFTALHGVSAGTTLERMTLQQHQLLEKLPLEKDYQEHWRRQQATIHFDDATQ